MLLSNLSQSRQTSLNPLQVVHAYGAHTSELDFEYYSEVEASMKASWSSQLFMSSFSELEVSSPNLDTWKSISEPEHAQKLGATQYNNYVKNIHKSLQVES